jgi:hypothetical protein
MILLQNPSIPTQVNAVEIDKAIIDINSELSTRLSWITHAYGRAYKNLDITNGERVYFPEVYLGKQNGSFRYTNISPDNDKTGQCFFLVRRETISQYQQGMYNFLNYDVAIIFSVNMKLINETLTETDIYQQVLVSQVRDVLTRKILGKNYNIVLNNIEYLFEDVYREFNLTEQSTIEKSPLSHFRINMSLSIPEECPVPTILPIVTCKSLSFDGVNEVLDCTNNAAFDFNGPNAFSIETWVKFDNLSGVRFVVSKWARPTPSDVRAYYFGTRDNRPRFAFSSSVTTAIIVNSDTVLSTGVWYHLIMTYDGSNDANGVNFYVDNNLSTKNIFSNNLSGVSTNTEPLQIGGQDTFFTAGTIAKVRMWNVELSASEVATQYNSGNIQNSPVQSGNLVVDTDIANATFGTQFVVPDLTTITSGYTSVNMESNDLTNDCPS